jgi:hypothetical protein
MNCNSLTELHTPNITHKVFSSQPDFQLSTLATNSQPFHTNLLVFSSPPDFQLTTTGGLPPVSSSLRQTPWDSRPEISFLQLNHCGNCPYVTSSLTRRWVCLLWIYLAFRQCTTYRRYSMLLEILPFALYTSPLSVQALRSRPWLSYVSYAATAA